jgi:hypothetical protein
MTKMCPFHTAAERVFWMFSDAYSADTYDLLSSVLVTTGHASHRGVAALFEVVPYSTAVT